MNYKQVAAYIQDDWRLVPRVTLNIGVRYEYTQAIKESNDLMGKFDPNSPSGLVQASGGNALYHPSPTFNRYNRLSFTPQVVQTL